VPAWTGAGRGVGGHRWCRHRQPKPDEEIVGACVETLANDLYPVYEVAPALFLYPLFQNWFAEDMWSVSPVVFDATRTSVEHDAGDVCWNTADALAATPHVRATATSNVPVVLSR
jgi:hypothetical protein